MNRTRAALAVILAALLIAACGNSESPNPSASQAASADPSVEASAEGSGGIALPSLPSGAADLEALIPDEIGDITLLKFSMQGNEFVNSGTATGEAEQFLEGLGVSTDDVSVAAGFGEATETGDGVAVFVFRAEGAGSDRLLTTFKEATDAQRDAPLNWESTTIGGKSVERAADPDRGGQVYLYADGDVLFFLAATQEAHATEALEALP